MEKGPPPELTGVSGKIRIKHQQTLWRSSGKDRVVRLDRKLVRVPKPVLEYVAERTIFERLRC